MKQRLARTRVAHLDRIACLDNRAGAEIVVDHRLDGLGADLDRNIACLQLPEHLMDENAVRYLHRDFRQVLVAAVHWITRLKGGAPRPALFTDYGQSLGRAEIDVRVFGRNCAVAPDPEAQRTIGVY